MGYTEKSYESHVDSCKNVFLSSTEEQWDKRRDAINNLKASVKEAFLLRNFITTCFIVATPIIDCIKSERTQLCNLAMDYVEEIARYTKIEFEPLAEHYLTAILRNCGRTNKIVRLKAGSCLVNVLGYAGPTSWFPRMLQDRNNENKDIRLHVAKGLSMLLSMENVNLSHFLSSIEQSFACTIADASSEVREFGFEGYKQYFRKFPEREQSFRSALDVGTLKTLEKLQARQTTVNCNTNKRSGFTHLKKQIKANVIGEPKNSNKAADAQSVCEAVQVSNLQYQSTCLKQRTVNSSMPKAFVNSKTTQLRGYSQIEKSKPKSQPLGTPRAKSSIGVYKTQVAPSKGVPRPNSAQSILQPTTATSVKRTNLTLSGGAQRILKKPEPAKKIQSQGDGNKFPESKIPLQPLNRELKKSVVKSVPTQPAAKVSSGMPTPNTKRTLPIVPAQAIKRPHSPHGLPPNRTKQSKTTRSSSSNFSRPTASSNARVSAVTEELKRKESHARGLGRKVIGTTGPLRVLRNSS